MTLLELEGSILLWIQEQIRNAFWDPIVAVYTQLGNAGFLWIFLCLLLLLSKRTRKAGFTGLLAMLFGFISTNLVLKHLVQRMRPWLVIEGLLPLVVEKDPLSFPSGHTCAAVACATAWFRTLPGRWMAWTGLFLAVIMGLSRLYVGVHFPSDVLGGALIGVLCGWAACRLLRDRLEWYQK